MRVREKRASTEVDWAVEAFMKACALEGRRHSLVADLALRLLDLEVGSTPLHARKDASNNGSAW